jgi:hypothetical protein
MKKLPGIAAVALLVTFTSCSESPLQPLGPELPPSTEPAPTASMVGLVEITLSGIGTAEMAATASFPLELAPNLGGASAALVPLPAGATGGIQLEPVSTASFTEGSRTQNGQRYLQATFRVRNAAQNGTAYDVARNNVTFIAVGTASTIPGTPVSQLLRFDGTPADPTIATHVVPTGAPRLDNSLGMTSQYADVLQVLTEAEVAAITLPASVTNSFPYGFIARNPRSTTNRVLAANPEPNRFDGLVTFAFRVPLQPNDPGQNNGAQKDPYTISVILLAVEDTETRVTESIEEQTVDARAAVAQRASALGASVVTVLNGSVSTGYAGQRQLCLVRTAGTAATPVTRITASGAYSRIAILRPGEILDGCAPNFRAGTAGRPAANLPFQVHVHAMDRYGNVKTTVSDSVALGSTASGVSLPFSAPLVNGSLPFVLTYSQYGVSTLRATARRIEGDLELNVFGITRHWGGGISTDWHTGGNWVGGGVPMALDSVVIAATGPPPFFPELAASASIGGVSVATGATLKLGPYDLTASASVGTGTTTGIEATTGRLVLTGVNQTIAGVLPRLRVTGTYTMSADVTTRAPLEVVSGRISDASYRLLITNF